ncbi:CcdB family protein [Sandarakinorhabdus sp.]|uniref:CcdB family protein n=1 Tax=Sandarakinorhabdus sp. TaxID=1916663 RepID=UPI003F6FE8FC
MSRFDVYLEASEAGLLLDCQSDLLNHLNTRLVVPLRLPEHAPAPARRLNPVFTIDDRPYVMLTQFAAAITVRECGPPVMSLAHEDTAIINALDMLISGY